MGRTLASMILWHFEGAIIAILFMACTIVFGVLTSSSSGWCIIDITIAASMCVSSVVCIVLHTIALSIKKREHVESVAHKHITLANVSCVFTSTVIYGLRVVTSTDTSIMCMAISVPFVVFCNGMAYIAAFTATPVGDAVVQWLTPEAQLLAATTVFVFGHPRTYTNAVKHTLQWIPFSGKLLLAYESLLVGVFPHMDTQARFLLAVCMFYGGGALLAVTVPAIIEDVFSMTNAPRGVWFIPQVVLAAFTTGFLMLFAIAASEGVLGYTIENYAVLAMTLVSLALQAFSLVSTLLHAKDRPGSEDTAQPPDDTPPEAPVPTVPTVPVPVGIPGPPPGANPPVEMIGVGPATLKLRYAQQKKGRT